MSRTPMKALVAAAVAVSMAVSPAVPVAQAGGSPVHAPLKVEDVLHQDVVIAGVRVPVPAALLGLAGAAAALGGVSVVVIKTVIDAVNAKQSPQLPPAKGTGEYLSRFDFSAVNTDPAAGGFSGIERIDDGRYIAISDDKGEHGPVRAYRFEQAGEEFELGERLVITQADGANYDEYLDPEEIRLLGNGHFLWTTEGSARPGKTKAPQIIESDANGREVRRIEVPGHHVPNGWGTIGVRDNKGPEAMAVLPGENEIVTINEEPLAQDRWSGLARVTFYDLVTGAATRELAVPVGKDRGITSVIADANGELYMLERGFFPRENENRAEIYKLDTSGAEDVMRKRRLTGAEKTMAKTLVFDFATQPNHPDNVEGLAWDGDNLIVVSDDNFSDSQSTLFHTVRVR